MTTDKITGLMIYYYFVCKRKLWYSCQNISMESENENVSVGKFIDESSYIKNRKHIMINNEINLDFIERSNTIHEIKKSRKIEKASIWQVKYYLYYLKKRNIYNLNAKIDYPLLKKTVEVELTEEDETTLDNCIQDIKRIVSCEFPPKLELKNICKSCAFEDLCKI
ncbi:CRISPR-associated protein Cas4 [Finegoldia magna]|uniref:CRISPR-associated protein Cas4 n=1 Tax=Finegoldia magna BVS033A4 TaxID=866773 RepID=E1KY01_FINMA|nr:CRISPR-associated protein Cas4 [Finegoldia magna]EFL54063.1 CRISPR-associated protein Cas4 [Finegoldia magna BVS033A4]MSB17268.1 Dna2/Cas4 domain-containing protein [Finegoldia magna]MSD46074.1 Dna2/Cas4 domain-containing protein [Finegoldia magna]